MRPQLHTVNGLAVETGLDRRAGAPRRATTPPDGQIHGRDAWLLRTFLTACGVDAELRGRATSPESGGTSLHSARERLVLAQAEMAEMKRQQMVGELVPAAEIQPVWLAIVSAVRSRLLAIPAALAPRLAGVTAAAAQSALREEIHTALSELASTKVERLSGP
jgi:hypothetical protein